MLVISARLAPFPPSRFFMSLLPSWKSYTYLSAMAAQPPRVGWPQGSRFACRFRPGSRAVGAGSGAGGQPLLDQAVELVLGPGDAQGGAAQRLPGRADGGGRVGAGLAGVLQR